MQKFTVSYKISGVNNLTDPDFQKFFMEEMNFREHIIDPQLKPSDNNYYICQITLESLNNKLAKKTGWEELYEIINAICNSVEGIKVTSLD